MIKYWAYAYLQMFGDSELLRASTRQEVIQVSLLLFTTNSTHLGARMF